MMSRLDGIMGIIAPGRMERRAKAQETLARADAIRRMTDLAADPALLEAAGLREPAVMPALRWLERHAPC